MRVWVNTPDEGWVQHGQERSSHERAAAVAKLPHGLPEKAHPAPQ